MIVTEVVAPEAEGRVITDELNYIGNPDFKADFRNYADYIKNAVKNCGAKIITNHVITELKPGQVVTKDQEGNEVVFKGDAVVLALGLTPNHTLANELRKIAPGIRVLTAGDTYGSRKIMNSTEEGYHAARGI